MIGSPEVMGLCIRFDCDWTSERRARGVTGHESF